MFYKASSFNQDLSNWNVSSVKNMNFMFYEASSFDQDISKWNVSPETSMESMFYNASSFNQDLSSWASRVPYGLRVQDMFANSNCTCKTTPQRDLEGPFCASTCYEDEICPPEPTAAAVSDFISRGLLSLTVFMYFVTL